MWSKEGQDTCLQRGQSRGHLAYRALGPRGTIVWVSTPEMFLYHSNGSQWQGTSFPCRCHVSKLGIPGDDSAGCRIRRTWALTPSTTYKLCDHGQLTELF